MIKYQAKHYAPYGACPNGLPNMVYLVRCRSPKFLPLAKTSDIPEPLYAIISLNWIK